MAISLGPAVHFALLLCIVGAGAAYSLASGHRRTQCCSRASRHSRPPRMSAAAKHSFDVETAVMLAGFAFEAYNEPSEQDARWERGADGCDVAFMSEDFARECYAGRLEVRLLEAKELAPPKELSPIEMIAGGNSDPYVVFALNEESSTGPREGAVALLRAVDRARSSTRWSSDGTMKKARPLTLTLTRTASQPQPHPHRFPAPASR